MTKSLYEIRQKGSKSMEECMLQIHEAMVVIHHVYPDWICVQEKNLTWDRFYHGLSPSLCDALGFTMTELPEMEQVNMSFDTLYTLAKKLEVWQPLCPHRGGPGPSNAYRDKYRRYPAPAGWVATLEDEELFCLIPRLKTQNLLSLIR